MKNIYLAGVGGQGILLCARIIACTAAKAGYDVSSSEIHGMAQRGGSVSAQIRFGKEVLSPHIESGTAHILAALEPVEALRNAPILAPDGIAFVSSTRIIPVSVSIRQGVYPENIDELVAARFPARCVFDAVKLAETLGNARLANTLVAGALSLALELDTAYWIEAIKENVKPAFCEANIAAFELGRQQKIIQEARA